MPRAYVSIGSNMAPAENVLAALRLLAASFGALLISSVYRTPAVGFDGDDFLNLVIGVDTELAPRAVADRLRDFEDARGRVRGTARFSSRTLDLDLLTHGQLVMSGQGLILPRPEIMDQAFVLGPLAEIAGQEIHPVLGKTYSELWAAMSGGGESMHRIEVPGLDGIPRMAADGREHLM